MPLWGLTDNAAHSVKYGSVLVSATGGPGSGKANIAANNAALYNNVSSGVFVPGQAVGQFAVSGAEMANTNGESTKVAHAGWQLRRAGTGPVSMVTIVSGGSGYANTDTIRVSGGTVNATATLTTNSTGGITNVVITNPGAGFVNVSSLTTAVINSTSGASAGTSANLTITLGGRAGRVHYETLVATKAQSNGTTDDTYLPQ